MNNFLRLTSLAATVAALALTAAPAQAASLVSAAPQASAKVKILKGLTLEQRDDLDFGTVVLSGPAGFTGAAVSVDNTGARVCDTTNLTCSDVPSAARYNVTGSNGSVVNLTIPASVVIDNLVGPGGDTLTVTITGAPTSVTLTNSGAPGNDFVFGGSISLDSTTPDGDYTGFINVTADYAG
jgi:hypothetical protein